MLYIIWYAWSAQLCVEFVINAHYIIIIYINIYHYMICLIWTIMCVCYSPTVLVCVYHCLCVFLLCTVMCTLCMCQLNGPPKVCWSLMFCSCFLQQWHQSKGSADTSAKPDFSAHHCKQTLFAPYPNLSNFSRCMVKAEILHQMRTGWIMYTHLVSQMDTSCYPHMILKKIEYILTITMSEV